MEGLTQMSKIEATFIESMGSDLTVCRAARVSFGKSSAYEEDNMGVWHLPERDKKLIKYLADHKHISPFGHCFASFHIKAPIFVRSQLVKHEYLRVNEISRRYVDSAPEFYVPDVWRGRAADKKQGSSGVSLWNHGQGTGYRDIEYEVMDSVMSLYLDMIAIGVAPEQARMVLPQSMMTEWWWSGSLDAFANMCNLRLPEDAQYESRLVAQQISDKMKDLFPVSWKALVSLA
jgi:thymidylate synthase (FAD)